MGITKKQKKLNQEYVLENDTKEVCESNLEEENHLELDYVEWTKFISYYRYYIDEFAVDILGVKLFPFQRLILRAMARYQNSMLIACRGIGKSWIVAVFYICTAILYPNIPV